MSILSDLFNPTGRMARLPYAGYTILMYVAIMVMVGVFFLLSANGGVALGAILLIIGIAACALASIIMQIKRLHDMDWAGAWVIALIVLGMGASSYPLLGLISMGIGIALFFIPGTQGPNRFGSVQ